MRMADPWRIRYNRMPPTSLVHGFGVKDVRSLCNPWDAQADLDPAVAIEARVELVERAIEAGFCHRRHTNEAAPLSWLQPKC